MAMRARRRRDFLPQPGPRLGGGRSCSLPAPLDPRPPGTWTPEPAPLSFAAFLARIQSPALRAVATHWREAASTRAMPGWKDIDPMAIAPHLPIVWAWKYDRATGAFTGRLAGDAIALAFGRQLRGVALHDFFADRDPDEVAARFRRIVGEPALMYCDGQVFKHAGRVGQGERIALPLAEDGRTPDGILGATTYSLPGGLHQQAPSGERMTQHRYTFFPLDGA